jgi:phospholipid transport system substrate-binding protein
MLKRISISFITIAILFSVNVSLFADDAADVEETVKTVMNSIRYGKQNMAAKQIDFDGISKIIMGTYWETMSKSDQSELIKNIEILITKISFPEGKKMFKHLDAILYGKPKISDNMARCKATIVVHRNYKKQENVIDFELVKKDGKWKITEMYIIGEGIFAGIFEDEVKPILKKGGVPEVMRAIRKKVSQVSK